MKATRAAIKTAKNLEELSVQVAEMQEQLNRIEARLFGVIGGFETPPAPELAVDEGTTVLKVKAK